MWWFKKKETKKPEEKVVVPPKKLFQLNESVELFKQDVVIKYHSGTSVAVTICETMISEIFPFYDGVSPYSHGMEVRIRCTLVDIKHGINYAVVNKGVYHFKPNKSSVVDMMLSMDNVFSITFSKSKLYGKDESATWVLEE